MNQPEGFTRLGYTVLENESIAVFKRVATELGLSLRTDQAGNVIARWEGSNPELPAVATGSHVDTVASGGGYDGVAGVLCALGAIKLLKEKGFTPKHSIEVINFRSEESSRFGISTLGSKAMSGLLDLAIGDVADPEGVTIKDAVEALGFEWEHFSQAERGSDEIKCFVELHIEQGTVIEDHQKQFGVVDGVACPIRLKLTVEGKAGHTGTTPMAKRQDALVAIAPLISFVSETALQKSQVNTKPVVATVSKIEAFPNVLTVIPGNVELGIDIRSVDDSLKKEVEQEIRQKCIELAEEFHVTIQVDKLVDNPSVLLSDTVAAQLKTVGDELNLTYHELDSGAGHDVMNMAKKWPSGLIFIPCLDGVSHHPAEHASIEDLEMGVRIIASFLELEASDKNANSSRSSRS
ncbi:M20 family metallo-hydrolase [Bacillus sp. PS06]|nr:M20 family metallo-hydrolase [Bacillus sp. PS06]